MTPLEQLLAIATDDQLRATRRLLHRAYLSRERLGWPTLNPFVGVRSRLAPGIAGPEYDLGEPELLPALCERVSFELHRRRAARPCLPCELEVALSLARHLPRADGAPVPSDAASELERIRP